MHVAPARAAAMHPHQSVTICTQADATDNLFSKFAFGYHDASHDPAVDPGYECGLADLENTAFNIYGYAHGLNPETDPYGAIAYANAHGGQTEIAGLMWRLLETYVIDVESPADAPAPLTPNQLEAYHWLSNLVETRRLKVANEAILEYNKWAHDSCHYLPPNTTLFHFDGSDDPACPNGPYGASAYSMDSNPMPPSLADFMSYGNYDANQQLETNATLKITPQYAMDKEQIYEAQGAWGGLLLGGVAKPLLDQVMPAALTQFKNDTFPTERAKAVIRQRVANIQAGEDAKALEARTRQVQLEGNGEPSDPAIAPEAEKGANLTKDADIVDEEVLFDADDALGAAGVAIGIDLAIGIAVGTLVVDASEIPQQLQNNLNAVNGNLLPNLTDQSGAGYDEAFLDFIDMLDLPALPTGASAGVVASARHGDSRRRAHDGATQPPDDGTQIRVGIADSNQTIRRTVMSHDMLIAAWPVGIDKTGPPFEDIAFTNGTFWHTPDPDQAALGLTGYLPSDVIRYYDWSGHERMALLDGDKFFDVTAPGSLDLGGADNQGDDCATAGECTYTSSLNVLGPGGSIKGDYSKEVFSSDLQTETTVTYLTDGSLVEKGPYYRISVVPDGGTGADWQLLDSHAQMKTSAIAGAPYTLLSYNDSTLGYDTTYTWHVSTRCPAGQPTGLTQGVPTCFGSPDYGSSTLAANESDLTSCTTAPLGGTTCTEDPLFNNQPVTTLTGYSVPFTFPTAGVYRVRLITRDQYGAKTVSDRYITVTGSPPTAGITPSTGWQAPVAFGPISDGQTVTLAGCLHGVQIPYATPSVTIDWGDSTAADTGTAPAGNGTTLSFHFGTTSSCSTPWQFTATHTYSVSSTHQDPVTVTVDDGLGTATSTGTQILEANLVFVAAPSFSSADHATFVAGTGSTFVIHADGSPLPNLTVTSGSLPPGIGITNTGQGTDEISGTTSPANAGTYVLHLQADNGISPAATQDFTLTVDAPPSFTSGASQVMTVGQSQTIPIAAGGYPLPVLSLASVSGPDGATSLPSDVSFTAGPDGSATLASTNLTSSGTYTLTLKATNEAGATEQQLTLVLSTAPSFVSPNTAGFIPGSNGSFTIVTNGSPTPSLQITDPIHLPSGLFFVDNGDGTATLSGTVPDGTTGSYPVTLQASNAGGTTQQTLTINLSETGGPAINFSGASVTTSLYDNLTNGTAYFNAGAPASCSDGSCLTITSSDGSHPLTLHGDLPAGLTFQDNGDGSATISGTPDPGAAGPYAFYVTAPGGGGVQGLAFLRIFVGGPPVFTSPTTATFVVGSPNTFQVTTSAEPAAELFEDVTSDSLPGGLTVSGGNDNTATISGTPDPGSAGTYNIVIAAQNVLNLGSPVFQTIHVVVEEPPAFTSASTAGFGENTASQFTISTSGSPSAALSYTGTLPNGLSFVDNLDGTASVFGTPTEAGDFPITVNATSSAGAVTQALLVRVGPLPSITSDSTATFTVGTDPAFQVTTTGDPTPAIQAIGLPSGTSLIDHGDGSATVSGAPDAGAGGSYTASLTATNVYGTAEQDLAVTVLDPPSFAGTEAADCDHTQPDATTSQFQANLPFPQSNSWSFCASGSEKPHLTLSGVLPGGLTFTDNGDGSATIAGAAVGGTSGTYPLTLTMTNSAGTATQALTLFVDEGVSSISSDCAAWPAGQLDSCTIVSAGSPTPNLTPQLNNPYFPWPNWLTFTDNGDGTGTFSGTPPADPTLSYADVLVDEQNGVPEGETVDVFIPIQQIDLTGSPPAATADQSYNYSLGAQYFGSAPVARRAHARTASTSPFTYSVTDGETLPYGLTLSPDGTLSGTPTVPGTRKFTVDVTDGTTFITSPPINVTTTATPHQIEIQAFRFVTVNGPGDWFVRLYNPTPYDVPLTGWNLGVNATGLPAPALVPLGDGTLLSHTALVISGPNLSSGAGLTPDVVGNLKSVVPGGFEVIAPDGTVTDRAGAAGADPVFIAGTGVPLPPGSLTDTSNPIYNPADAYSRIQPPGGLPQNTDDNSADFVFGAIGSLPTHALLSGAGVRQQGAHTIVHWKVATASGIAGFRLTVAGRSLVRGTIPVHRARTYRVVLTGKPSAPIVLHIVLISGGEVRRTLR